MSSTNKVDNRAATTRHIAAAIGAKINFVILALRAALESNPGRSTAMVWYGLMILLGTFWIAGEKQSDELAIAALAIIAATFRSRRLQCYLGLAFALSTLYAALYLQPREEMWSMLQEVSMPATLALSGILLIAGEGFFRRIYQENPARSTRDFWGVTVALTAGAAIAAVSSLASPPVGVTFWGIISIGILLMALFSKQEDERRLRST